VRLIRNNCKVTRKMLASRVFGFVECEDFHYDVDGSAGTYGVGGEELRTCRVVKTVRTQSFASGLL
jgi:hypothetical protein